jgi:hypothetical protein
VAVHHVHLHVADHHVHGLPVHLRQRLLAVAGGDGTVTAELDGVAERFAQSVIILDDQNAGEISHGNLADCRGKESGRSIRNSAPPAAVIAGANLAAVLLHGHGNHGQAQARTAGAGGEKRVEEPRQDVGGNARPVVADPQLQPVAAGGAGPQVDVHALTADLHRIHDQVAQGADQVVEGPVQAQRVIHRGHREPGRCRQARSDRGRQTLEHLPQAQGLPGGRTAANETEHGFDKALHVGQATGKALTDALGAAPPPDPRGSAAPGRGWLRKGACGSGGQDAPPSPPGRRAADAGPAAAAGRATASCR